MIPAILMLTLTLAGEPQCPEGYTHQAPLCVVSEPIAAPLYVGEGVERWRPWVEVYFQPWDVERALAVIQCESRGDPNATNPSSGAAGLFQHMPRYWSDRSWSYGWGGWGPYGVDANVAVAGALVYHGGGWRHWNASRSCWG